MTHSRPADHPPVATPRLGVLIVNLGTPYAPTAKAVKRYLGEFLSDRRVVEIPPLLWQPILRGIILNVRPKKSAHAYAQVWTDQGSPLAFHTKAIADGLANYWGEQVLVDWAMRYGQPAIGKKLAALKAQGCERILLVPLYPQYCGATTATVVDAAADALKAMRWQPTLRTMPPWYDDPAYISALAERTRRDIAALPFVPDRLVVSFHGMPQRTLELGDPYHCQCRKTARLLGEALGQEVLVTFQSRFGRAKWLEPATDSTLEALPGQGIKRIAVLTPGFATDCLETLEEIALRGRDQFVAAGGTDFAYLSCLNAEADAISLYQQQLTRELGGWLAQS
jgi:protoporphyrin/coproporphyrin ferrochelatase